MDTLEFARTDRSNLFEQERLKQAIGNARLDAVVALSGVNVTSTSGIYTQGYGPLSVAAVTTAHMRQAVVVNYFVRPLIGLKAVQTAWTMARPGETESRSRPGCRGCP